VKGAGLLSNREEDIDPEFERELAKLVRDNQGPSRSTAATPSSASQV